MKKRVFAALMAFMLFSSSAVISFAETADKKSDTEQEPAITTGTQEKAVESEVDVDADIQDQVQSVIPEEIEEIRIGNADDFMKMVENCKLDTWSVNKKIVLTDDISLVGKDFKGIPSFGGIFDGMGHTVSDANIKSGLTYVGFFTHIEKTAAIMNLNVTGSVLPQGNTSIIGGFAGENSGFIYECSFKGVVKGKDYTGGIVGINNLSGDIRFCSSEGFISGTHFTGGVAGKNAGNIANCRNEALVNTTNTDTEITIDSMEKLNTLLNLIKNGLNSSDEEANADVTVSDTGGIAGISIGIITRSINNGDIGYEHVGYNVGGIAGRQSGYIVNCSNNGTIRGRKDVGGIVGQAEPYITVDLASDIAYQLQQAVSKLHDTVTATLNDTKNQSNVISARLAVIQQFTGAAVEDTRFLASGAVDYANGISGATNEAFSRVDYILEEASKNNGILDKTTKATDDVKASAKSFKNTVGDLNIENYIKSDDEKRQYNEGNLILNSAAAQYTELSSKSQRTYYNMYVSAHKGDLSGTSDLVYVDTNGNVVDESVWSNTDMETSGGANTEGSWKHSTDDISFPINNSEDTRAVDDTLISADAAVAAEAKSASYAADNYVNPVTGTQGTYTADIASQTAVLLAIYEKHLPEMSNSVRSDAQNAMTNLESAADNLSDAGKQTKSVLGNVAGKPDIAFPTFSDEFRARTTSLADNMAGMNDNFGLLNQEVNNATGVLVDDLQDVNDQFNNILNLYTDAIDGVLEKDYTNVFNDNSLDEASKTTDATVDSCFNFGICQGDIDTSGIAGTMGIEYDFDKESDITGLKDSKINTSYLTKCVLRDNRNYGDITSQKNYAGGICGLQEMGTILNCGSYSAVKSTSGQYVGGVAGASISYIKQCYAKGELDGDSYVGGVAGDGKHIRDCLTIVSVDSDPAWCGAIAGHITENGEVRGNYFVSDTLSGIDRVSYSMKAEPIEYEDVLNNRVFEELEKETTEKEKKVVAVSTGSDESVTTENYRDLPYEFSALTINFVLEDEDLENGYEKVGRLNKNYGESLSETEYPGIKLKEGFYPSWDVTYVDKLTSDMTITATYKRYKTTLAEPDFSDELYQSELLVDGQFKENDELKVEKTIYEDESGPNLENFEEIKVIVPNDGAETHQIRFKPMNIYAEYSGLMGGILKADPILYLVEGDKRTELKETGRMGDYSTYEIAGNEFMLSLGIEGAKNVAYVIVAIVAVALIILVVILIIVINTIKKHGGKLPGVLNRFRVKVEKRIENKEQLFYDDSKDDIKGDKKEETEVDSEEKPEENPEENPNETADKDVKENSEDNDKENS